MRQFSTYFDDDGRLVRVGGDVSAMQTGDAPAGPENRMREIDLGSIEEGTQAPPIEEKGFFGKMMESIGF
jgi:hypothetical protein